MHILEENVCATQGFCTTQNPVLHLHHISFSSVTWTIVQECASSARKIIDPITENWDMWQVRAVFLSATESPHYTNMPKKACDSWMKIAAAKSGVAKREARVVLLTVVIFAAFNSTFCLDPWLLTKVPSTHTDVPVVMKPESTYLRNQHWQTNLAEIWQLKTTVKKYKGYLNQRIIYRMIIRIYNS